MCMKRNGLSLNLGIEKMAGTPAGTPSPVRGIGRLRSGQQHPDTAPMGLGENLELAHSPKAGSPWAEARRPFHGLIAVEPHALWYGADGMRPLRFVGILISRSVGGGAERH